MEQRTLTPEIEIGPYAFRMFVVVPKGYPVQSPEFQMKESFGDAYLSPAECNAIEMVCHVY